MCNIGVDGARFRVQQPAHKNVRVIYQPGMVAAGITTKLEAEIFCERAGEINDVIKIVRHRNPCNQNKELQYVCFILGRWILLRTSDEKNDIGFRPITHLVAKGYLALDCQSSNKLD